MIQPIKDIHAILLIEELKKHPRLSNMDTSGLSDKISDVNILDPDNFVEDLKELDLKVYDSITNTKFSIGMFLIHDNIENYSINKSQHRSDKKGMKEGKFPYTSIIGDLKYSADIVDMMKNSTVPYSLLGKLETQEVSQADNYIYKQKTPILIVAGADYKKVMDWENKNTININEPDGGLLRKTRVYINNPCFNF